MAIIASYHNEIVEVLDAFECGGVKLAAVKALDGKPFVGGDRWPVYTEYATVKAAELAPVEDCTCTPLWVTACPACKLAIMQSEAV